MTIYAVHNRIDCLFYKITYTLIQDKLKESHEKNCL